MTDKHEHENEDQFITLVDPEGNEELYEILLTFESDEFEKSYVLVYPAGKADDEELDIFAFAYDDSEEGLEGELIEIESEEEWDMIEEVLGAFTEDEQAK